MLVDDVIFMCTNGRYKYFQTTFNKGVELECHFCETTLIIPNFFTFCYLFICIFFNIVAIFNFYIVIISVNTRVIILY